MNQAELCARLAEWNPSDELEDELNRAELLPVLHAMIPELEDGNLRKKAYAAMGKLLQTAMDVEHCQFLVDSLGRETDKYVLDAILAGLGKLTIPSDVKIEAMIACSRHEIPLIRCSGIYSLRASNTQASRKALRYWVRQKKDKTFRFEMTCAIAALGYVGEETDIALLESHLQMPVLDIRRSAQIAIDHIRSRMDKTG